MFSEHTNCAGCHHHNPIQCSKIARPYYHLLYFSKTKKMNNNNNNKYDDDDDDDDDQKKLTELLSTYNTDTSSQTTRNKQRNDKAIKTSAKEINNTYTLQKI